MIKIIKEDNHMSQYKIYQKADGRSVLRTQNIKISHILIHVFLICLAIICIAVDPVAQVIDTTAADDTFNASYLAARLQGASAAEAARQGNRCAGIVIQHRGGVIPKELFAAELFSGSSSD